MNRQHNIPAMAAGVIDGANGRLYAVTGVRSVDGQQPVTLTDKFHVGSCAKSITATLMLRLACAGCFTLDDTLPPSPTSIPLTNMGRCVSC